MNTSAPSRPSTIDAARDLIRRGFAIVPIPLKTKAPTERDWQKQRLTEADLPAKFGGKSNIGILLGEPSGGVVDVDLDHELAVKFAPEYLPPTDAIFGREGKPRSHWLYHVTSPTATQQFKDGKKMVVEIRSDHNRDGEHRQTQTIAPGSVHPSGEPVRWDKDGEPAEVSAGQLVACVTALYARVKQELGDTTSDARPATCNGCKSTSEVSGNGWDRVRRCHAYLEKLPDAVSGQGGHNATLEAACTLFRFGLSDAEAASELEWFNTSKTAGEPWTPSELAHKLTDARDKVLVDGEFGCRLTEDRKRQTPGVSTARTRTEQPSPSNPPEAAADVPSILLGTDEYRVIDETSLALSSDPHIFQRSGMLVRIVRQQLPDDGIKRDAGSPAIVPLQTPTLREKITRFCRMEKIVKKRDGKAKRIPSHPPQWLVSGIHARGEWPKIRNLTAVSDVPILRTDGTVLQEPGFDAATGVLYQPNANFPRVHPEATIDDAAGAAERLVDLVRDFPFESTAHRSAWLAALITRPARHAYSGPTPLFLMDANVRGAGKTLLAQIIGQIDLGRDMPVSSYSHEPTEMRKVITASAIAGDTMLLLDNIVGPFGNAALDMAVTTTRWKDRILGRSENTEMPLLIVWFATGNNICVAADMIRRVIHVRLDSMTERPEERGGFKYPDLIGHIRQHRPQLLVDALTISAAYIRAGRPKQSLPPFGSFEGWSALIREAIVWLGYPDPCLTRQSLAATADSDGDVLVDLMDAWAEYDYAQNGLQIPELVHELYKLPMPTEPNSVAMRAALESITGCPPGKPPAVRQIGNKLKGCRHKVSGGRYFDHNPLEIRRGGAVWRLQSVLNPKTDANNGGK